MPAPDRVPAGAHFLIGVGRLSSTMIGSRSRVHNTGESNTLSLMRQNTIKKRGVLVFLW